MYPLRGALIRVRNDGVGMPPVLKAHCVSHEQGSTEQDMVFIVPRGTNTLLLGGLTEPHQWSLDLDLKTYGPVQEMLRRCRDFLPALAGAELDRDDPLRVGLRPFRQHNVRVEREPGTDVIHNYGHGGSGVTLSWGCAEEVVSLVKETVGVGEQEPLRRLVSA
jgi:D-amino-acid oxidase